MKQYIMPGAVYDDLWADYNQAKEEETQALQDESKVSNQDVNTVLEIRSRLQAAQRAIILLEKMFDALEETPWEDNPMVTEVEDAAQEAPLPPIPQAIKEDLDEVFEIIAPVIRRGIQDAYQRGLRRGVTIDAEA